MIGNTPSVLMTSSLIIPPANITPPKRAIQSPALTGKGMLPPCPKTTHKPPSAKLKLTIRCQPCFFFKKIIAHNAPNIGAVKLMAVASANGILEIEKNHK